LVCSGIWGKVFCNYTRDPRLLGEWIDYIRRVGAARAISEAAQMVNVEGFVADAITLGFGPQVLVAAAAARVKAGLKPSLYVITSPEVVEGRIEPAKYSHMLLKMFESEGLIEKLHIVPMAPNNKLTASNVVNQLLEVFNLLRSSGIRVLDVSGGTQLVPLAALKAGIRKFTYTYPVGDSVIIYGLEV
jgi:hypothetical protein